MPSRSVKDHVSSLLSRRVAEEKSYGAPNQALEATAIFESIALNLVLRPRAAYYFSLLAKNGLLKVVNEELRLLDVLDQDIRDLANPSYKIEGEASLVRARTSLLQLEGLPKFGADPVTGAIPPALKSYFNASSDFITKGLAKNVRTPGSSELARPSSEAAIDLLATMASLKPVHADFLSRLSSLSVGVKNFSINSFSSAVGSPTISRVRRDLDGILETVRAGGAPDTARDLATRMFGSRSVLQKLSTTPDLNAPLIPAGTTCTIGPSQVVASSSIGPFVFPNSPSIQMTVGGVTYGPYPFFIGESAILVSDAVTLPLTIPAATFLMLSVELPSVVVLVGADMSGTYSTMEEIAAKFAQNLQSFSQPNTAVVEAVKFANYQDRWMLYCEGAVAIQVISNPIMSSVLTTIVGVDPDPDVDMYINTINKTSETELGFGSNQYGTTSIRAIDIADAIAHPMYGAWPTVTASASNDVVQVLSSQEFSMVAPDCLGLTGSYYGKATITELSVSLANVQIGDTFSIGGASSTIGGISPPSISFSPSIKDQVGVATIDSVLKLTYLSLQKAIDVFLASWKDGNFSKDLAVLDRAIAPLAASKTAAQRGPALAVKGSLAAQLNILKASLEAVVLPPEASKLEISTALGIIATLQERGYNRAADLLMRCDIQSLLGMDDSSASYSGNFLKKASAFATNSMKLTRDETDEDELTRSISSGRSTDAF
jgi:hypothetical protein